MVFVNLCKTYVMRKLIASLVFLFVCATFINAQVFNEQLHKFGRVVTLINTLYVDSVSEEKIVETAIIEMLKELDPHSVYINKDEVARMNEPLEGSFEGIGIQFRITDDTLIVSGVISGGPSEKVGIHAGDRIVSVDNQNIAGAGLKNEDVVKMLRGDKGSLVTVEVRRPGMAQLLDFTITRDKIPIFSVDAGYISKEGIGYIKLNKYSKTTMEELNEVFNSFQKAKVNKIILDLTDNTGGYLDQSIQLVDEFMSDKQMIVYTEGVNSPRQEYRATSKGRFDKCKLVIVVDEGSASASEITAGAVQDWDRGVIIGRRTFGKGLVQRPFMLPDGSMIRLTVARYYTPSGRTIQKPYSDDFEEYSLDIVNRYRHGEFTNQDSISFPDSLKYETLINQRTVYGGGGIMPDIFIPIDTVLYGEFHYAMLRKGLMFRFVNKYIDDNREKLLKNYAEIATFESDFTINDEVLAQLYEFGRNNNIDVDTFALPSNIQQQRLKVHIKALMAGELWKTNEFYRIFNEINPNYIEAKAVLLDNKKYESLLKKK